MKNLFVNILIAGLIAGTMDILAAIFLLAGGNAAGVFRYIASGAFGKSAMQGGTEMIFGGLIFHYLIAMSWVALYFFIYPKLSFLKHNKWLSAIIYGAFVWTIMNLIIVPSSQIGWTGFNPLRAAENMLILMVCIGLPASLSANRFYKERN